MTGTVRRRITSPIPLKPPRSNKPPKISTTSCTKTQTDGPLVPQRRKDPAPFEAKSLIHMVGVKGFEPSTPCTPCKCATRLRHTPIEPGSIACETSILRQRVSVIRVSQTIPGAVEPIALNPHPRHRQARCRKSLPGPHHRLREPPPRPA